MLPRAQRCITFFLLFVEQVRARLFAARCARAPSNLPFALCGSRLPAPAAVLKNSGVFLQSRHHKSLRLAAMCGRGFITPRSTFGRRITRSSRHVLRGTADDHPGRVAGLHRATGIGSGRQADGITLRAGLVRIEGRGKGLPGKWPSAACTVQSGLSVTSSRGKMRQECQCSFWRRGSGPSRSDEILDFHTYFHRPGGFHNPGAFLRSNLTQPDFRPATCTVAV